MLQGMVLRRACFQGIHSTNHFPLPGIGPPNFSLNPLLGRLSPSPLPRPSADSHLEPLDQLCDALNDCSRRGVAGRQGLADAAGALLMAFPLLQTLLQTVQAIFFFLLY